MANNASYECSQQPGGETRISVVQANRLNKVQMVLIGGLSLLLLGAGIGGIVLLVPVAVFYLWAFKWNYFARCREHKDFLVGPKGVTTDQGAHLAWDDIARLYLTAPKQEEIVFHAGRVGGKSFSGISTTGGATKHWVNMHWTLIAEARGQKHVLVGGMSETVAHGVMHEIGKRKQVSDAPSIDRAV